MESLYISGIPRITAAIAAHQRLREDEAALRPPESKPKDSPYAKLRHAIESLDAEIAPRFVKLEHIARDFASLGSDGGEVGDSVAISWATLLWIFRRNEDGCVSSDESRLITSSFGPCPRPLMQRAAGEVHGIRFLAGEEPFRSALASGPRMRHLENVGAFRRDRGVRLGGRHSEKASWKTDPELGEEFNPGIRVVQPRPEHMCNFSAVGANQPLYTGHLDAYAVTASADGLKAVAESLAPGPSTGGTGRRFSLDLVGLVTELSSLFSDADSLVRSLFEHLCSPASADALQAELMDLFGFERFELVGQILQNRDLLVAEYKASRPAPAHAAPPPMSQLVGLPKPGKRGPPVGGQSIVVQSESEVRAAKGLVKEWKRANKGRAAAGPYDAAPDIDVLRRRELEYEAAAAEPVFKSQVAALHAANPAVRYPHVYDATVSRSGFTALLTSSKIVLPANAVRKSERNFEEVTIPHPERIASAFGLPNGRKNVSSLPPVAQMAFHGTKTLNQIQSIVYDAAFKSNENLLICAPTGAGKTNVAMLTVVRCIMNHMEGDRIERNNFKVIYIAPMKALAAEMTRNFGARLQPLGITVKELTGDTQLTKSEIANSQMLVVTPEKWDVVTRKGTGDSELVAKVRLLIIDEVHLLHDDRGPVIETIVARTRRQIEFSQRPVRIVGLSATLPNYVDVAEFLHVNPFKGLFFFDGRFRPVPLTQTFVGVKSGGGKPSNAAMDEVCYERVIDFLKDEHQVLVFVHTRNGTAKVAMTLKEMASNNGKSELFTPADITATSAYHTAQKAVSAARSGQVRELFGAGLGIHHAGLPRPDRTLTERLFAEGHIRVLCCTSTLAWGVNLPAHAVIIRGTDVYDAKQGSFVDLGILDVQQIFGRAGRPQFDKSGHGTIITAHDKLNVYVSRMLHTQPIESQFINSLADNLNAEIALGTVTNVEEGISWLESTYLYVRAKKNPLAYGLNLQKRMDDPDLYNFRKDIIIVAAMRLDQFEMIRYDQANGVFASTDTGRIASHFYIKADTVEILLHDDAKRLNAIMTDEDILSLVAKASEFQQIRVRDEEMSELDNLVGGSCRMPVRGGGENVHGKVNILLQAHLSRAFITGFSLLSDSLYILQNATRILRALFEISLRRAYSMTTGSLLRMSKAVERQMWPDGKDTPLWQFIKLGLLTHEEVGKVQQRGLKLEQLRELDAKDITHMLRAKGERIKAAVAALPLLDISVAVRPLTATVLKLDLQIIGAFEWSNRIHGAGNESFFIWVENPDDTNIYHHEYFLLPKAQVIKQEVQRMSFAIPIKEHAIPNQYIVRWSSERWVGSEGAIPVSFRHLILPNDRCPHTELLDLRPLPISAFEDPAIEALYPYPFFNAVQTQIFHTLFHSDVSVLVGAPTGSGKTLAAEMAIFRVFKAHPGKKVVYVAPLKALVRERVKDWRDRIEGRLGKKVVELTGDFTPDVAAIKAASLIVTTPEKWDGISRSWQSRSYVRDVALIVIDEIHLLGEDRGPVLEVLVARTNFMAAVTQRPVRVVGLSTALANAGDLADWLAIPEKGLFNFRPSVRPVPTVVHISGYSGKHYCPRMATMNKPAYTAIKQHSSDKPVLIFVSSRRQTRLTALDLMALSSVDTSENKPKGLWMDDQEMHNFVELVKDETLKTSLTFGIGIHHAGLHESDRSKVEELFVNRKIQILIATATLAWGVNFPAHLVIVKGTEIYDGKTRRYVDMPVTDVLQMVGRAGRPQYDDHGVACVFVQDTKKPFYRKFLYEPFPVESSLKGCLADHLNAEIVAGTISSKQEAMDYLTWTYLFRRVLKNPRYYGLGDELDESAYSGREPDAKQITTFLTRLVDGTIGELEAADCVETDGLALHPRTLGHVASFYYLRHKTMRLFADHLGPGLDTVQLLHILSEASEYDELPVRHNEDEMNRTLAGKCPLAVESRAWDDPHTKAHLLYQVHFSRLPCPIVDYDTDRRSVIDNAIRIIQAMLDVVAENGWLDSALEAAALAQMVYAARWSTDPPLSALPHVDPQLARAFRSAGSETVPEVAARLAQDPRFVAKVLKDALSPAQVKEVEKVVRELPLVDVVVSLRGAWERMPGTAVRHIRLPRNRNDVEPMELHAEQEYTLLVSLNRTNASGGRRAWTPGYSKYKEEGWVIVLGDVANRELLALKRVPGARRRTTASLAFALPYAPELGSLRSVTLFVVAECYLGLDQQYAVPLRVLPPSIEAQINEEVTLR